MVFFWGVGVVAGYATIWKVPGTGQHGDRPALVRPAALVVGLLTAPAAPCTEAHSGSPSGRRPRGGRMAEEWAW